VSSFKGPDLLVSLTTLLGVRPGMNVSVRNAPPDFLEALLPMPEGATLIDSARTGLDLIVFFTGKKLELVEQLTRLVQQMSVTGSIWVAFPTVETPLSPSEDFVRLAALEMGLEDTKRVFLGPAWLALRLQRRSRVPRIELPQAQA